MTISLPQLRVRTEFSFRAAYGPLPEVAARLAELGCPAAGIVDPGTWGHVRWAGALAPMAIQPLFGAECPLPQPDGRSPRAWLLLRSPGPFYQFLSHLPDDPTVTDLLAAQNGAIRFPGGALGPLESVPEAFDYIDLSPASLLAARTAYRLSGRLGKKIVLTSDNAYPSPADRPVFQALTGAGKVTPQHILSDVELRAAFGWLDDDQWAAAVAATHEVAERLQGIKLDRAPLIQFDGDLRAECETGRQYRLAAGHIKAWTPEYADRLKRELEMIAEKKFESYFLVVGDLVRWAKTQMLVGPARGSSAGSLVCYLLRITEVDPIPHDLLFERFIDINRNDLPDIDIDFSDRSRDRVFDYLAEKYGRDNVARLGNISTLKPRSVLAEAGKRLGIPAGATFSVRNVLFEYSSGDSRYGKALEDTLTTTQPGRNFMEKFPEAKLMGKMEGHAWHTSVHAAGVVVCNEPVTKFCVVRDGIAHLDKPDSEALNLLKIDALGLRTLGVIEDSGCVTADELYSLPLNDPKVFAIFNDHKYAGVFQFEGAAQRRVAMQVPIVAFQQIDHVTALARPGPLGGGATNMYIKRNNGAEPVEFRHPSMAAYLADTRGVVLYQEQVMRISREIGQLPWKVVSEIRKSMSGRKGKEYFDRRGAEFREGAMRLGLTEEDAQTIWDEICSFGAWGMNKCVAGSTRLKLAHPNQFLGPEPTIAELHEYYVQKPTPWIRQRDSMPILLAFDGAAARPAKARAITFNGLKPCIRLSLSDGRVIECTREHKFIINGKWAACSAARIGDEFLSVGRANWTKPGPNPGRGKGWRKGRAGAGRYDRDHGISMAVSSFWNAHDEKPCEDCNQLRDRMEVHHNDHNKGLDRPEDLAWLCSSCHKQRHMNAGDWLPPYAHGWIENEPAILLSIDELGHQETYDIEMPEPNHSYVLANGIVTHNSHTVSYSVIAYWCAWMKAYHPLEYAAALMRNAKDDNQILETLRELVAEGVRYIPFDPELSELDWAVKDGALYGGFQSIDGVGPAKAAGLIERRTAGKLTKKDLALLAEPKLKFADLREAHTRWGDIYDDPDRFNIHGRVYQFGELRDQQNAVVIAKVVRRERRDRNETLLIAKRGGKVESGQTLFLDLFGVDDSVSKPILLRVGQRDWHRYGEKLADGLRDNEDWLLLRGRWLDQFSMMSVDKVKCLTQPELV